MRVEAPTQWAQALSLVPETLFVMTAAFDGDRAGILVSWVQQCGAEPPMVSVAVRKGRPIEPIIRDSHAFALCGVACDDRFLVRKLRESDEHADDVLDTIPFETLRTGSPCILRASVALDCEVVRHIDLEGDHELYVGQVVDARVYNGSAASLRQQGALATLAARPA